MPAQSQSDHLLLRLRTLLHLHWSNNDLPGQQATECPKNLDQYHANLVENRRIDFELILSYAYDLTVQQPSISTLLASLFSCVLVDEYQDTKEIQYAILASILKAGQGKVHTFIVGDPNQAIYELRDHRRRAQWRGST